MGLLSHPVPPRNAMDDIRELLDPERPLDGRALRLMQELLAVAEEEPDEGEAAGGDGGGERRYSAAS